MLCVPEILKFKLILIIEFMTKNFLVKQLIQNSVEITKFALFSYCFVNNYTTMNYVFSQETSIHPHFFIIGKCATLKFNLRYAYEILD